MATAKPSWRKPPGAQTPLQGDSGWPAAMTESPRHADSSAKEKTRFSPPAAQPQALLLQRLRCRPPSARLPQQGWTAGTPHSKPYTAASSEGRHRHTLYFADRGTKSTVLLHWRHPQPDQRCDPHHSFCGPQSLKQQREEKPRKVQGALQERCADK